jgi:CO/xanthine dehydrogenase FAD-binding subunit
MLPRFSYIPAHNRQEALSALALHDGTAVLAGGTDLVVRMKRGEAPQHVVDIGGVAELSGVTEGPGTLRIGAGVTHARIASNPSVIATCRALSFACGQVGSPQIRNMGTLGGNLVNASPAADSLAPLLIHNTSVTLESIDGERTQSLDQFIVAPYRTTIGDRELLTSVNVETLRGYEEGYRRVAKRATWAISRLSLAWALRIEDDTFTDARISIGSCTPVPFRPGETEAFLKGKKREGAVTREAVKIALEEIRRVSGMRASFAYKLPVVRDLLSAVLGGAPCL